VLAIPDLNYETGEVQRLETTEEYKHARMEERHFFVLNEAFVRAPLSLRKITKADKSLFYVRQARAGVSRILGGGALLMIPREDGDSARFPYVFPRYWAADLSRTCDYRSSSKRCSSVPLGVVKANSTRD